MIPIHPALSVCRSVCLSVCQPDPSLLDLLILTFLSSSLDGGRFVPTDLFNCSCHCSWPMPVSIWLDSWTTTPSPEDIRPDIWAAWYQMQGGTVAQRLVLSPHSKTARARGFSPSSLLGLAVTTWVLSDGRVVPKYGAGPQQEQANAKSSSKEFKGHAAALFLHTQQNFQMAQDSPVPKVPLMVFL